MKIFSKRVVKLWNEWEVRATILLSLFLQMVLIVLGTRRKYTRGSLINIVLWVSYLSADWFAALCLGNLAGSEENSPQSDALQTFWAPFLLLHLGGPDAITAYALEDNELWLRHLLMLAVHFSVACYVFLKSWTDTALMTVATISMFVAGIIKYGERTWALRSASAKQFEDSLLSTSPDVAFLSVDVLPDARAVHEARFLFGMFRYLFANLSLTLQNARHCNETVSKNGATYAFELVEVELGFLYDVLYTKAAIIHSLTGTILRIITFSASLFALFAFSALIDKKGYPKTDIAITYALLLGSIALELYATIRLVLSDWTLLWLTRHKNRLVKPLYSFLSRVRSSLTMLRRCSGCIHQLNLIDFCLKQKTSKSLQIDMLFSFSFMLKTYWNRTWVEVDSDMKDFIFEELFMKYEKYKDGGYKEKLLKELLSNRGEKVLKEKECGSAFRWAVLDVEFAHSLLLWHIATDICYHHDMEERFGGDEVGVMSRRSKELSDYMLYVLLMRPTMLPKWIGRIAYLRHTYQDAMSMFRGKGLSSSAQVSKMLLQARTQIRPLESMNKEKESRSVMFGGCRLAKQLLEREDRWEIVGGVWVEMVTYAATECGWRDHAQQLMRGGELLTQVCVLMANMGLSTQIQFIDWPIGSEANEVGWPWSRSKVRSKVMKMQPGADLEGGPEGHPAPLDPRIQESLT